VQVIPALLQDEDMAAGNPSNPIIPYQCSTGMPTARRLALAHMLIVVHFCSQHDFNNCRMVAIAIPLCLVGVALITQPSFLGFSRTEQRNLWGIVFASGQVRSLASPPVLPGRACLVNPRRTRGWDSSCQVCESRRSSLPGKYICCM